MSVLSFVRRHAAAVVLVLCLAAIGWDVVSGGPLSSAVSRVAGDGLSSADTTPKYPSYDYATAAQAPDIQLETLEGDTVRLSEYRGKVVVLNFWATWCPPCRREIPDLMRLQDRFGSRGLRVIGVSLDREGKAVVQRYVDDVGIDYTVGIDDGSIAQAFGGVPALPTTYIIGRSGRIRGRVPGLATEAMLASGLRGLLNESPSSR
jgi:peroxiredoxin